MQYIFETDKSLQWESQLAFFVDLASKIWLNFAMN